MEGTFGDDIWWGGAEGPCGGGGRELAGSQMGQGSGGQKGHMAGREGNTGEGGDGRGQKDKMVVAGLVGAGGGWWPDGRG